MVKIYTDGSSLGNPGPSGWAVLIRTPFGVEKLSGYSEQATNNQMEIRAVLNAMLWSIENNYYNVEIYCDSKYCVNGINQWMWTWNRKNWKKPKVNRELWKEIFTVYKDFQGKVVWIKGHAGDFGNEAVDNLARWCAENQATLDSPTG